MVLLFRELHKKFLSIHLVLISATMLLAFVAIFMLTFSNLYRDTQRQMQQLLEAPTLPVNQASPPLATENRPLSSRGILQSFKIFFNQNNQPLSYSSFLTLDELIYEQALEQLPDNATTGVIVINDQFWYYELQAIADFFRMNPKNSATITNFPPTTNYQIAFLDITTSVLVLRDLSLSLLAVSLLMFFIIVAISYYFTKQAIRPVQRSFEKQQQFIADASHELKTPLAIISANTDALFAHQNDTIANQKQWLIHIQAQSHRMNKLINDLLLLARNDAIRPLSPQTPTNCSLILQQAVAEFEVLSFEKGLPIISEITDDVMLNLDADSFQQLCFIFLDNALKYTVPNGKIFIALTSESQSATLTIQNSFPTMSETELTQLFDRFYRADSARTYNGSFGLGLSIAQQLLTNMHATITTKSVADHLIFSITFPK